MSNEAISFGCCENFTDDGTFLGWAHPIADTHSFIRHPSDTYAWLASSHAELELSAPGNAEPQLGAHAPAGHILQGHGYETPTRRPNRHCSRVRWPRFPHLAPRPHPSKQGSESAFTQPVHGPKIVRRDVRRRHRGQRPTATEDPHTKRLPRRPSRHCSRVRRPRFPQLAPRPHPSRHRYESASTNPVSGSPHPRPPPVDPPSRRHMWVSRV